MQVKKCPMDAPKEEQIGFENLEEKIAETGSSVYNS